MPEKKAERFLPLLRVDRKLYKYFMNESHLPGPTVLTDILSTDHPGDDGREGGHATAVG